MWSHDNKNCPSPQQLLDFFNKKIEKIRQNTGKCPVQSSLPSASTVTLDSFKVFSADDIRKTIMNAPSKSCALDPVPTNTLKEFLPELLPFLTCMCNASLQEGYLPTSQRHALVTPRLKKPGADQTDVINYRPISNLSFISKIVERLVCQQLVSFLEENKLLPNLQSAYRKHHSTETVLLKVVSDILRAADIGHVSLLCLLDLSAAFDTVDHNVLIDRLQNSYGLNGTVLSWIKSFVHQRTQSVVVGGGVSTKSEVKCGVPQGSVQ